MSNLNNPDWTEKYRPNKLKECIIPSSFKDKFQAFVDSKFIPNLIISGSPGIGKTTVARAMLDELGFDYLFLNTSLFGGIDTLRDTIMEFASSMSFSDTRKYIILDEADRMSSAFQEGLRGFIETYSANAGFILTCNHPDKIIDAIHSRCELIEMFIMKEDFQTLAKEFYTRMCSILELEEIKYYKPVIVELLKKVWPDFRQGIVLLKSYSTKGTIDSGILSQSRDLKFEDLIILLKNKKWSEMRDWVGENFPYLGDFSTFANQFYKYSSSMVTNNSLPIFVELWNRYDYQNAFVIDKEINVVAFLTEFMNEMTWK